jgi:hypothetical protein
VRDHHTASSAHRLHLTVLHSSASARPATARTLRQSRFDQCDAALSCACARRQCP